VKLSIDTLYAQHCTMFGRRNRFRFRGIEARVNYLMDQARTVQDGIRKKVPKDKMERRLVRLLSRIFCVADYYGSDLGLAEGFARKWLGSCAYCGCIPCECQETRKAPVLPQAVPAEVGWSLAEVCTHLNKLYGDKNRVSGLDYLVTRLFSEVAEVSSVTSNLPFTQGSHDELEEMLVGELSDGIAWTIALANELGIDLEEGWAKLYASGCPRCTQQICQCGPFFIRNGAVQIASSG